MKVAYILEKFPTLSETFVLNEIDGLVRSGLSIYCFSLWPSREPVMHERAKGWLKRTVYPEPIRHPEMRRAHRYFFLEKPVEYLDILAYTRRYGTKRVFWTGIYFARLIKRKGIGHVHAHLAKDPTDVAMLISRLLNISFSFSAHANDIYCKPDRLDSKIQAASFAITCTRHNQEHIARQYGDRTANKVHLIYHGIDTKRFQFDRTNRNRPIDILSVGRLIRKKGFVYLIKACRILRDRGLDFRCMIVGEGPQKRLLESAIARNGLANVVALRAAVPEERIIDLYKQSNLFALPCIIAPDGDRDGMPNVLLEAMATGLPVVSTPVSGIPELIDSPENGVLVPPRDAQALADAIAGLLRNKELRKVMGFKARQKVEKKFEIGKSIPRIAKLFSLVSKSG